MFLAATKKENIKKNHAIKYRLKAFRFYAVQPQSSRYFALFFWDPVKFPITQNVKTE